MKKKIIGIFVCMLLIATALPIVSSIDKINEKNDLNVFISNEIFMNYDCGCGNSNGFRHRFGMIEEKLKPLNMDETSIKPAVMDDLPEYFNWMDFEDQDWTTPVKDQSTCGSCYAFAALGSLESIINIREGNADLDLDLSEQYVLSCLPRAGNCVNGGFAYKTFFYIMSNKSSGNNCNGIIPESCFPYQAIDAEGGNDYGYINDPVLCDEKCENWEEYLIPISDSGYWYPDGGSEDIEAIKTQVIQDGPVAASMMATYYIHGEDNFLDWGWEHHDSDDYYPYPGPIDVMNHCVVIVGWKDDPSIDNGGYWICKNSWGTEWGYNGFFNIEYGSLVLDSFRIAWVDYNPEVFVNWAPVADAGGPYYGDVGHEITFDGRGSFDYEGEIISYEWDFGDGYNEYGMNVTHMYDSEEVYPVKLTIRDNESNIVNDTTWAFIGRTNDPPNTPSVNGPSEGKKGTEYEYKISTDDPDDDDVYYFVYWGDTIWESWIGPFSSGEEITLNHTFFGEATYTLRVKAKDCYDFKSDWEKLEVTMPKNKPFNFNFNLMRWFFERFPNALPILKHMLRLT